MKKHQGHTAAQGCINLKPEINESWNGLFLIGGMCAPCILVLRNIQVLARDRDGTGEGKLAKLSSVITNLFSSLQRTQ